MGEGLYMRVRIGVGQSAIREIQDVPEPSEVMLSSRWDWGKMFRCCWHGWLDEESWPGAASVTEKGSGDPKLPCQVPRVPGAKRLSVGTQGGKITRRLLE